MLKPKFKKWLDRELKKGYSEQDLLPTIKFFDENPTKFEEKDIYKWDGKDLENHIKAHSLVSKRKSARGEYEKLAENDDFLLVCVKDVVACQYWGVGTKWCITMDEADYFNQYRNDGAVFYFLIDKSVNITDAEKPPADSKYAIVIYRDKDYNVTKTEYYDSVDDKKAYKSLPKRVKEFLEMDIEVDEEKMVMKKAS